MNSDFQANDLKLTNTPQFPPNFMEQYLHQNQYPYQSLLYENLYVKLPQQYIDLDEETQNELKQYLNIQIDQDPYASDLFSQSKLEVLTSKSDQAKMKIQKLRSICEEAIFQIQSQFLAKEEQNLQKIISEAEKQLIINTRPKSLKLQNNLDSPALSQSQNYEGIDKMIDLIASTIQYSDQNRIPEAKKLLLSELQETELQISQKIAQEMEQEKHELINNMSKQIEKERKVAEEYQEEKMRKRIEELTVTMQQKYPEGTKQRAEIQQQVYRDLQSQFEKKFEKWKQEEQQKYGEEFSRRTEDIMQNVKNMSQEVLKQHLQQLNEEQKQTLEKLREQLKEDFFNQIRNEKELKQLQSLQLRIRSKVEKELKEELRPQIEQEIKETLTSQIIQQVNNEHNKVLEYKKKQLENDYKMKTSKLEQNHEQRIKMESERKARIASEQNEKQIKFEMKKQLEAQKAKLMEQVEKEFQEKLQNELCKINDQRDELVRIKAAANVQIKKLIDSNKNKAEELDHQQRLLEARIVEIDSQLQNFQYNNSILQSDLHQKSLRKNNFEVEKELENSIQVEQDYKIQRRTQSRQNQDWRSISPNEKKNNYASSRSKSPAVKENLQFISGPLPPPWEPNLNSQSFSSNDPKQTPGQQQNKINQEIGQDILSRMVQESVNEAKNQALKSLQKLPKTYNQNYQTQQNQEELKPQVDSTYSKLLKGSPKTYY